MPTVALIGPELFPIPPIRGGAAELFIEKVADHFTDWRPVVIGVSDPDLPRHETRGQAEYHRVPLEGWRRWLYCRYRNYFPLYDREVARIIQQTPAGPAARPQPAAAGPVAGAPLRRGNPRHPPHAQPL